MEYSDLLIPAKQLIKRLDDSDLRIVDCRWSLEDARNGRAQYDASHIPQSQYVPLEPDLSDPAGKLGRHPLPSKARFVRSLRSLGVDNTSIVVVYDDGSCMFACRFWWMMRWVGHQRVRVLDGGLHQWQNLGYPLSTTEPQFESTEYMPSDSIARVCTTHDILKGSQTLIDARAYDRFQGKNETLDHTGGHIPGAVCYPFVENQAPDKTFIANSDRFNAIDKNKDIVCYCGSGISATHNILALLLAGFPEPTLYPGSWSEWIEDPNRPIA